MEIVVNYTYYGHQFAVHTHIKSLCYTSTCGMHVNYISTENGSADAPVFKNISHHLQERKAHTVTRATLYQRLQRK